MDHFLKNIIRWKSQSGGRGQMVSVLAFFTDNTSSNHGGVYNFWCCKRFAVFQFVDTNVDWKTKIKWGRGWPI